ncbi:MAG: hypothetical protein HFJ41_03715 [Clostridia bacterium]|nr:hypothetical protein [Clostridia bacterium]
MKKDDIKLENKKKLWIIIVLLLIFCIIIIGIITAISNNNKVNKFKSDLDKQTEEIYKLYGGKENYEKEQIFKQIENELSENQKLYDIKFEDNSYNVTFIIVQEKNPNRIYNWLEAGIPEGQTYILDRDTRNRLTNLYGPEYIYTDKVEYYIYNRFTNAIQNCTLSLEETINSSKWEGFRYNYNKNINTVNPEINSTSNILNDITNSNENLSSNSKSNILLNTDNPSSNINNSSYSSDNTVNNNNSLSNNDNSYSKDNSEEIARLNSFIQYYEEEKKAAEVNHNEYLIEIDKEINKYKAIISDLKIALQKNESGYQGDFIDVPILKEGRISNHHTEISNQISYNTSDLRSFENQKSTAIENHNDYIKRLNKEINKVQEEINRLK